MLANLIGRFFRRGKTKADWVLELGEARDLWVKGDPHAAIAALREYLKNIPGDVEALNYLGACLSDVGETGEAFRCFDLAYALDDTFTPVIVNYAKAMVEQRRNHDALPLLRRAWATEPYFPSLYAVYGNICLNNADVTRARTCQLRAWMGHFDNARLADGYLFESAYDDIDELTLAAEHRFWAETVAPIAATNSCSNKVANQQGGLWQGADATLKKVRIGYWSPDFRNHSVRYFFRPLLEGHDVERFETYVYHDSAHRDKQTELIEGAAQHFFDVHEMTDAKLRNLINSHHLDILVEVSGHTSYNRLAMLQEKMAPLQISALAYPPTTGMPSIDCKLMDRYTVGKSPQKFYAERPMVLPSSFWCFDPIEDAPMSHVPPLERKGYVTFACVGNVAKINERMLRCWKAILDGVVGSRLVVRSISFEDTLAVESLRTLFMSIGFSEDRIDLCKPEGGASFYSSYDEIDIVLDTYPFNGGTTTCFATYQGVPVVSMAGSSLISRMGLSVMTNLGFPDFVVDNEHDYVSRAIDVANDLELLRKFRREARSRFKNTALGNNRIFSGEFESACLQWLSQPRSDLPDHLGGLPVLPSSEIIRRAYMVASYGQEEAADRILAHCIRHYPDSGLAHIFIAQKLAVESGLEAAQSYLNSRMDGFPREELVPALVNLIKWAVLLGDKAEVKRLLEMAAALRPDDLFDQIQLKLYHACALNDGRVCDAGTRVDANVKSIKVLISCDEEDAFERMWRNIHALCTCPPTWSITFVRCDEVDRVKGYEGVLNSEVDLCIFLQKTVHISNPTFFVDVVASMTNLDVLGIVGATRWNRLHWRTDAFQYKAGGFLVESTVRQGGLDIQLLGVNSDKIVHNLAILDGSVLAIVPSRVRGLKFDDEFLGAEWLMEEDWTFRAYEAGLRLGVHRNLGVTIRSGPAPDVRHFVPGRMNAMEKRNFDPFDLIADDFMVVSAPVADALEGMSVLEAFFESSAQPGLDGSAL